MNDTKVNDTANWLLTGNGVSDESGNIYKFSYIVVRDQNSNEKYLSIDSLGNLIPVKSGDMSMFKIYLTPEQKYIKELEDKIKAFEKSVSYKETRKYKARLRPEDVKAIEDDIIKGGETKLILSTYDISQATYHRVVNGQHRFSTNKNVNLRSNS